jgi:glycosyltransferase involved in cell wall biosynthesis
MPETPLPPDAERAIGAIKSADLVIGIPSYNNARTIGHVVRAAQAGLTKYFPQFTSIIVNSDGGSRDGTQEAVLSTQLGDSRLLMLSTPMYPVHRLSFPYHGIPGKGSAFRMIFELARQLRAKVCIVVDSDLRSITPEWIDLLGRPILYGDYDLATPYYHRHKYDGTITNSIVYPMTRALYGARVRQPIGGDFGISGRLVARYLARDDWETDVARYGIDIWMTTVAIAEEYRVCQSFLGAKLHDAKDPGADLSAMLHQVVGSVFTLMEEYRELWTRRKNSEPVEVFGFRFDVGLDPVQVNVERMINAFRAGCRDLGDIWSLALHPDTHAELLALDRVLAAGGRFRLPDELWARVLIEFASAHHLQPIERGHLLRSLTPLYLARVASFVIETELLNSIEVEAIHEELCLALEQMKPYLVSRWNGEAPGPPLFHRAGAPERVKPKLEVKR